MRIVRRALVAQIMAGVLLVGPVAGSVLAGNKHGNPGAARGSCAVNPNPVAVGADWTLTGSGLGASRNYTVSVSDAGGVTYFFMASNASGTMTFTWHSYHAGTSSVAINETVRGKTTVVAACAFQVV